MGKGGKWAKMGYPGGGQRRRHGRALLRPRKRSYRMTSKQRRVAARRSARLTKQVAWGLGPSKRSSSIWGTIWLAACLLWLPAYIVYKIIYR